MEYDIGSPRSIFRIHIKLPPALSKKRGEDDARRASGEMTEEAVSAVGAVVLRKLRMALSKQGKFKVGATGEASRNLLLDIYQAEGSNYVAEISEGMLTKANFFIRHGSEGHGRPPPYHRIREWMLAKRIPVYLPSVHARHRKGGYEMVKVPKRPTATGAWSYEQVRYTRGGRPWKKSRSLFEQVLKLIIWSIALRGTSKFSRGRPPYGLPYFDYMRYVAEDDEEYVHVMRQKTQELAKGFVQYAIGGHGHYGGTSWEDTSMSRFRTRNL